MPASKRRPDESREPAKRTGFRLLSRTPIQDSPESL
jgi:hypothetical protein